MRSAANEVLIRRFFLGDLSEEERNRIEDEYLAVPEHFEELLAIENDLVDGYVRGELSMDDIGKFEGAYLGTPERREKVDFARALNLASAQEEQIAPERSISFRARLWDALSLYHAMPRWALAASLVGLAAIGYWQITMDHNLQTSLRFALARQAELEQEDGLLRQHIAEIESAPSSQDKGRPQHSEATDFAKQSESQVALSLVPGGVRGAGSSMPSLHLPHVQLLLMLDKDNYKTYRAELQTADGETVARSMPLRSENQDGKLLVAWRIPAQAIQPGDFVVQLKGLNEHSGFDDVQSYTFRALAQ